MRESMSTKPAQLPEGARHAGEVHARWAWFEPSVWTERMLTGPNAFFAEHGLFSLWAAYAAVRQSA